MLIENPVHQNSMNIPTQVIWIYTFKGCKETEFYYKNKAPETKI